MHLSTDNKFTGRYTTALEALAEIAQSYFFLGRIDDALRLLHTALQLAETGEVAPQAHLKLLLLDGKISTVKQLIHRDDPTPMFSTLLQAKQLAEETKDQQGLADALSLLGQAHCNATTVSILKTGALPFGQTEKYKEALAFQQQALSLQETLQNTRGISESLFGLGLVYQFWQKNDLAREHFTKALQVAEQHGHILEQAEPHRHLMLDAQFQRNLDEALAHAQLALSSRETSGFKPYQPFDHLSLRDLHLKKGETAKAQFHLQQAARLAEEMGFSDFLSSVTETTSRLGD